METEISVNASQEKAFEEILNYLGTEKRFRRFLTLIKPMYEIKRLIQPSHIEVVLPSWGYTFVGKVDIEVVPRNEKSLVKMDFKWSGRETWIRLLALGLVVVVISELYPNSLPFTILLTIPFFFGWLSVVQARDQLITDLRQWLRRFSRMPLA